ncbi:MAG: nickel pincer cofactor biosynthesis protein LarC [Pseudomonadota bacterium]
MKIAYIDAVGGIAGDMLLSGFLAAGIEQPERLIAGLIGELGLDTITFSRKEVRRGGLKSWHSHVEETACAKVDWHSFDQIAGLIEKSSLHHDIREKSIATFKRLAEAEARAHGKPLTDLHLHETGQADAIIEIAGTLAAIRELGIEKILCSPLPMGRGTIQCRHGLIPLPAPAVAEMLEGIPVRGVDIEGETVTPTGMALIREIVSDFGIMPQMKIEAAGSGAGFRESGKIPNIVRVFTGTALEEEIDRDAAEKNLLIETNIDDMAPVIFEQVFHRLFEAGALDVFATSILMKKGRPAQKLSILCEGNKIEAMLAVVFTETTSTGVRFYEVTKRTIPRRNVEVETPWGNVAVKVSSFGNETLNISPEYEACLAIADRHAMPVRKVIEDVAGIAREKVKA